MIKKTENYQKESIPKMKNNRIIKKTDKNNAIFKKTVGIDLYLNYH